MKVLALCLSVGAIAAYYLGLLWLALRRASKTRESVHALLERALAEDVHPRLPYRVPGRTVASEPATLARADRYGKLEPLIVGGLLFAAGLICGFGPVTLIGAAMLAGRGLEWWLSPKHATSVQPRVEPFAKIQIRQEKRFTDRFPPIVKFIGANGASYDSPDDARASFHVSRCPSSWRSGDPADRWPHRCTRPAGHIDDLGDPRHVERDSSGKMIAHWTFTPDRDLPERTYEDGLRDGMKAAVRHGGDPGNAAVDRLLKRYLRGVSYQED